MRFATAVEEKLKDYEALVKRSEVMIAAALDPRVKGVLVNVGVNVEEVMTLITNDYKAEYLQAYEAKRQAMYPRIQLMARNYLAPTATSVPSECASLRAGTTINKRRARLGDDDVQAICELQSLLAFNAKSRRRD
ncbi:hypothetical protein AXG93_942s1260 [Marchantia polymorpha subsp. ruderalis]|uniref:HAT C-terminal dimerisation domain-containing protein n=1 Tax=Marchantia polymorpha subsp. ruderalis TaxID=1480154 RepID=A0A176WDN6_MARPO|nr:hypothetical protein AXG93_942s1260 [Marchantia polymorpha subsp. ruderalis]